MIRDLRDLLDGWEFELGKISVRKIIGQGGREKIQTRVDLGLLQLEPGGRPDGKAPHGCESLLDYHERRLAEHFHQSGDDEGFALTPEDCRELRHEAYLFYQRYLSCFVLEDWDAVERDTLHNLRLIDFCLEHAAAETDQFALEPQRPYTIMMHTRATVYAALRTECYADAVAALDTGLMSIADAVRRDESGTLSNAIQEMSILQELRQEVLMKMPGDAPARLEWELQNALDTEDYEHAARLRDKLASQKRLRNAS